MSNGALTPSQTPIHRYYYAYGPGRSDHHGYAQRTRFLTDPMLKLFQQCVSTGPDDPDDEADEDLGAAVTSPMVRRRTKRLWS